MRATALLGSAVDNPNFAHVFLGTVVLHVMDKNGVPMKMRALLDSGSQVSVITEKMFKRTGLGLEPSRDEQVIQDVDQQILSASAIVLFKAFVRKHYERNVDLLDRLEGNVNVQSLYNPDDLIEEFKILEKQYNEFDSIDFTHFFKSFKKFLSELLSSNNEADTTYVILNFMHTAMLQRINDLGASVRYSFITDFNSYIKELEQLAKESETDAIHRHYEKYFLDKVKKGAEIIRTQLNTKIDIVSKDMNRELSNFLEEIL